MPLGIVSTQKQAQRECSSACDAPMNRTFREIKYPPPYRSTTCNISSCRKASEMEKVSNKRHMSHISEVNVVVPRLPVDTDAVKLLSEAFRAPVVFRVGWSILFPHCLHGTE